MLDWACVESRRAVTLPSRDLKWALWRMTSAARLRTLACRSVRAFCVMECGNETLEMSRDLDFYSFSFGNIKFHVNSVAIQLTRSIFLDFFQNKIIDDKSKGGALWSILCSILPYMLRIKKKQ